MAAGRALEITTAEHSGGVGHSPPPGPLLPPDREVVDALLDPWILLRAVRDGDGDIVDFEYMDMNRRAEEFTTGAPIRLIGRRLAERRPELRSAGLVALLADVVDTAIAQVAETIGERPGMKQMGQVMKAATAIASGKADGARLSAAVKERL